MQVWHPPVEVEAPGCLCRHPAQRFLTAAGFKTWRSELLPRYGPFQAIPPERYRRVHGGRDLELVGCNVRAPYCLRHGWGPKCSRQRTSRSPRQLTNRPAKAKIGMLFPHVGLWRSWERASMAWKRSSVRSRSGPPNNPPKIRHLPHGRFHRPTAFWYQSVAASMQIGCVTVLHSRRSRRSREPNTIGFQGAGANGDDD